MKAWSPNLNPSQLLLPSSLNSIHLCQNSVTSWFYRKSLKADMWNSFSVYSIIPLLVTQRHFNLIQLKGMRGLKTTELINETLQCLRFPAPLTLQCQWFPPSSEKKHTWVLSRALFSVGSCWSTNTQTAADAWSHCLCAFPGETGPTLFQTSTLLVLSDAGS